jgi:type III pantothenate kinase
MARQYRIISMQTEKRKPSSNQFAVFTLIVGNTHSKLLAWRDEGEPLGIQWRTGAALPAKLRTLLSADAPLVIGGVVPAYLRAISEKLKRFCRVLRFRKDIPAPIQIVPRPASAVGDDRIAAALGALALNPQAAWVIIDAGTAITINAVSPAAHGRPPRFEGGLILPGTALSLAALSSGTAQLPKLTPPHGHTHNYIGRSTQEAMRLGVQQAQLAAVIELADRQMAQLESSGFVCLTGGGAAALLDTCRDTWRERFPDLMIADDLVHLGLRAAYESWQGRA